MRKYIFLLAFIFAIGSIAYAIVIPPGASVTVTCIPEGPSPTPPPTPTAAPTPNPTPVSTPKPTGSGILLNEGQKLDQTVSKGMTNAYYFTLPAAASTVVVQEASLDWIGNANLFVGLTPPACGVGQNNTSNQMVSLKGSYTAGTTFYITVCGVSNNAKYRIYWNAY